MILQCSHIDKSFVAEDILKDVSFHVNDNEKVAIVGVNGSGKSTILKIIMGMEKADAGDVILPGTVTVGYLAQNQDYDSDKSIFDEMQDAKPEIIQLEKKMQDLSTKMDTLQGEELDVAIKAFDQTTQRYEQLNGYAYQSELTGVLKGLGFAQEDFSKSITSLSGGEKTRVALAKMLLQAPDLIILDEPTNHLDMSAIAWLEGYLSTYNGAVLIVAHDRYFLDKIVTKVVELRQTHSYVYQGNYTDFIKKRQDLIDDQMRQYENQQATIKHQQEVITKLRSFNREKSIKRAESRVKMLDKMEVLERPTEENTQMRLRFTPAIQSGNDVLSARGLSKSFGDVTLFSDIDFEIKRGEHVAIIGDNGTGKTTLLKIIKELLPADTGVITLGTNVEIGYYDQEHQVLHPEKTLFDEISDAYPDMTNTEIRNTLAAFLFTEDDVFKQIKSLSGGERGRVSLAKLMLSDANFLLLDEPTNHLDIDSKEILEDAIRSFEGTVLYVSHDRYFVNTTATRILHLTDQKVLNYIGNYDYFLEKKEAMETAYLGGTDATEETSASGPTATEISTAATSSNLSWQQQKEAQKERRKIENALKKVESEIDAKETRITELDQQLADPANGTNVALLQELSSEKESCEERLMELMEQWEELSSM